MSEPSEYLNPAVSSRAPSSWYQREDFRRIALGFLSVCLVIFILTIRKPDAFANPQFWAEDGTVFFEDAYKLGLKSILAPYSGYLHFYPRLAAFAAMHVPFVLAPTIFNWAAILAMVAVVISLHSSRLELPFPPAFALALVFVPQIGGEVFANLTNVQWSLALLLLLVVCKTPPQKPVSLIIDTLTILVAGLSTPLVVPMSALFVGRYFLARKRSVLWLTGTALLTATIQILIYWKSTLWIPPSPEVTPGMWAQVIGGRGFEDLILGVDRPLPEPWWWVLGGSILMVVMFWRLWILHPRSPGVLWLLFAATALAMPLYKFRFAIDLLIPSAAAPRYFYLPHVLLVWCLVLLLWKDRAKPVRLLAAVLLVLISWNNWKSGFQSTPLRNYHWEHWSALIGEKRPLSIPINPPGWSIDLDQPDKDQAEE